ncbi:MAG: PQQ-dependent sugar dehydrogenase [Adhaeribacter sp.]
MHHHFFALQPVKNAVLACLLAGGLLVSCKTSPASGPPTTAPGGENQVATSSPIADPGPPPEENRLVKTVLSGDLNEPMELAVAADGRVFFIERSGKVFMYEPTQNKTRLLYQFPIPARALSLSTDGLMGLTLDPGFAANRYLYFFYTSQQGENFRNNLSRFQLRPDFSLDPASEKVLLSFPIYMQGRSHTGGSLAWDRAGNLYLSTGDDVLPSQSQGYAPADERPGRAHYDAQSTSANTNDLRGKILRIHPEADGSYTIPPGNLFAPGTPKTRPEIYVMGCRNPYRISVDQATGIVYWGEIGPDAGTDSERGPKGYDEFNQARQAGNFGWPLFVGNNQAYRHYDFATKTLGEPHAAAAPVNRSVNNTGLQTLPPAQPAMVWYPYEVSPDFPALGKGGRSAMGGPVYHYDPNLASPGKLPPYYDKALFLFDWMRNWIFLARLDGHQRLVRLEPFMPQTGQFRRPMDLEAGPDGALYLLEYGSVYNADNADARLVRITYNGGNRPPVARIRVSDSLGLAPLMLRFDGTGSQDADAGDSLRYEWTFGGNQGRSREAQTSFTFLNNGIYPVVLKVSDRAGASSLDTLVIKLGNTLPQVQVSSPVNTSFYFPKQAAFPYTVQVQDREDARIDPKRLQVQLRFVPQAGAGHPDAPQAPALGKTLLENSDCKACHQLNKKAIGPALVDISRKYRSDQTAVARLANKVIAGGGGVWGPDAMNAHPQLSREEATAIVQYVLSLATQQSQLSLPRSGKAPLQQHQTEVGHYQLTAAYTDQGGAITPLTGRSSLLLRPAHQEAEQAELTRRVSKKDNWMELTDGQSWFGFRQIDLAHLKQVRYRYAARQAASLELHLDSPQGPVISRLALPATGGTAKYVEASAPLQAATGRHDLYFVPVPPAPASGAICRLDWVEFKVAD